MKKSITAKEKADELIKSYLNYVSGWVIINKPNEAPSVQYDGFNMTKARAKQCAKIAVDWALLFTHDNFAGKQFLLEVRKELEQL